MRLLGWFRKLDVSHRVLRIIIALTVVVFAAFFLIGYNHPFAEDPDFIEPRLTPLLLCFVFLVLILAVGATVWAVWMSLRKRRSQPLASNGVNASRIAIAVAITTALMMLVSFLAGSTAAISVNGQDYGEPEWLKVVDMFVFTSLALMVLATLAVAVSTIRSHFRKKK